ncbi:hypothetical protein ACB098_02G193600 [Castanea mollissima]
MAVSFEALAMAGVDYLQFAAGAEDQWEQELLQTPPHLLVEEEEEGEDVRRGSSFAFPNTHIFPRHHSKDYTDDEDEDEDEDDRVTITCQPRISLGETIDNRIHKWLRSIRLMVTAIIRLLTMIRMDVEKRVKSFLFWL